MASLQIYYCDRVVSRLMTAETAYSIALSLVISNILCCVEKVSGHASKLKSHMTQECCHVDAKQTFHGCHALTLIFTEALTAITESAVI
ncbi:hypothetical protein T265_12377 [Opisthorchis viverrini]|uniref:Uncharacterized protein n=1 Tax=Opisthorchis viverrini TaxID=6198 RepID=A0A074YY38_OPIVI|nr:hypothetical protein T265_12377 [Opisthorchis viverrini]KER18102.1 hypothetical protein T265_12377 [Opisthorchis viverrini]